MIVAMPMFWIRQTLISFSLNGPCPLNNNVSDISAEAKEEEFSSIVDNCNHYTFHTRDGRWWCIISFIK